MGLMEVAMLPRSTRWMKKFLNDDAGVTALAVLNQSSDVVTGW